MLLICSTNAFKVIRTFCDILHDEESLTSSVLEATQDSDGTLLLTNQLPFPTLYMQDGESGTGLALERPILLLHAPHKPFPSILNEHSTTAVQLCRLRKTWSRNRTKTAPGYLKQEDAMRPEM